MSCSLAIAGALHFNKVLWKAAVEVSGKLQPPHEAEGNEAVGSSVGADKAPFLKMPDRYSFAPTR